MYIGIYYNHFMSGVVQAMCTVTEPMHYRTWNPEQIWVYDHPSFYPYRMVIVYGPE